MLLHPRLPPVVHSLGLLDAVTFTQETEQEKHARQSFGFGAGAEETDNATFDTNHHDVSLETTTDVLMRMEPETGQPQLQPSRTVTSNIVQSLAGANGVSLTSTVSNVDEPKIVPQASFSSTQLAEKPAWLTNLRKPSPAIQQTPSAVVSTDHAMADEEDEEMPTIDLGSDSDVEE